MLTTMRLAAAIACIGVATGAAADPVYTSADFSGGLNSVTTGMKTRLTAAGYNSLDFNCVSCLNATQVTGHVIYDSSMTVPSSPPAVNVFSIGAIPSVPDDLIFELNIGDLSFHFGDAGILGGPAIQYLNGNFNGFFFAEDFTSPNGASLRLNVQGRTFTLARLSGVGSGTLFSGFINTPLDNLQPFDPTNQGSVPEPTTLALLAAGMLGLGLRRRKGAATADQR